MLAEFENKNFSHYTRTYFSERAKNAWFDYIISKFISASNNDGLTKAELARRIGKRPEQITRLLGAPGNWTLDTIQELLMGISGEEMKPDSCEVLGRSPRNFDGPDWIKSSEHDMFKFTSTIIPPSYSPRTHTKRSTRFSTLETADHNNG